MSLQAEDPIQVAMPGTNAAGQPRQGGLVVEAGARARARNIDIALAVACFLIWFPSMWFDPPFVLLFRILILAVAIVLLVRTSRRQPVAVVDRVLQWILPCTIIWSGFSWSYLVWSYLAWEIYWPSFAARFMALVVVVVTVVRRWQNPPFSMKRISAAHQTDAGLTGGVLEVTDVNGVRVRIPAGRGMSPSTNGFAIVSLITALVGLGGVLAVIFGHIARSQIRRTGERGWGMATAGLIIGYIGIVVGVAVAIVYFYALSRL
jgi:Domain of unknown function (DUF4190)